MKGYAYKVMLKYIDGSDGPFQHWYVCADDEKSARIILYESVGDGVEITFLGVISDQSLSFLAEKYGLSESKAIQW